MATALAALAIRTGAKAGAVAATFKLIRSIA